MTQQEEFRIVSSNIDLGNSLRELLADTSYPCSLVTSLGCLARLDAGREARVTFIDRALDAGQFVEHASLLEGQTLVTFGEAELPSESLQQIESRVFHRLPARITAADVQALLRKLQPQTVAEPARPSGGITGESRCMTEMKTIIDRVAPSKANVLLLGETGTGKEVAARRIHELAGGDGLFVPVNCSAIPAELLESELFGHKKGAFSGAISDRIGRFELAAGGTLFLDEIGDMPLALQAKLLRVLEERVIYPVGGDKGVPMTARLVAATHCDLEKFVESGEFRKDLYYRLNVVPITIPALRERVSDIPDLVSSLSRRFSQDGENGIEFSAAAIDSLKQHDWPGNVRELANVVERLSVLHQSNCVDVSDLPANLRKSTANDIVLPRGGAGLINAQDTAPLPDGFDLKEHLRHTEATLIRRALDSTGGTVSKAARLLQVRRTTLTEKVKRLGLDGLVREAR